MEPEEPGVRPCQRCGWLFVSRDPMRIRRCQDCKDGEEIAPKALRYTADLGELRPLLDDGR